MYILQLNPDPGRRMNCEPEEKNVDGADPSVSACFYIFKFMKCSRR